MRFSIFTILAMTGYAAVAVATYAQPLGMWRFGSAAAWIAVIAYLLMLGCDPVNRGQAVFGRVAVACIAAYMTLTFLSLHASERGGVGGLLPHRELASEWAARITAASPPITQVTKQIVLGSGYGGTTPQFKVVAVPVAPAPSAIQSQLSTLEVIVALHCSLAFGLLCGSVALVRSGCNERRRRRELQLERTHPLMPSLVSIEGNYETLH